MFCLQFPRGKKPGRLVPTVKFVSGRLVPTVKVFSGRLVPAVGCSACSPCMVKKCFLVA